MQPQPEQDIPSELAMGTRFDDENVLYWPSSQTKFMHALEFMLPTGEVNPSEQF